MYTPLTRDEVIEALTKALVSRPLPAQQMTNLAAAISEAKYPVVGFDVCTVGTCIDHVWDGNLDQIDLSAFLDPRFGPLRGVEIFPEGIRQQDRMRIRTTHGM